MSVQVDSSTGRVLVDSATKKVLCCEHVTLTCDAISASKTKCGVTDPNQPYKYFARMDVSISGTSTYQWEELQASNPPGLYGCDTPQSGCIPYQCRTTTVSTPAAIFTQVDKDTCVSIHGASTFQVDQEQNGLVGEGSDIFNPTFVNCNDPLGYMDCLCNCSATDADICNTSSGTGSGGSCPGSPSLNSTACTYTCCLSGHPNSTGSDCGSGGCPCNSTVNFSCGASYTNEYTTAELISKTIAALPAYDDSYADPCNATYDLNEPNENSFTVSRFKPKFSFVASASVRTLTYNEHFTPTTGSPTDTPRSLSVAAGLTFIIGPEVLEPSSNGTITITAIVLA